jgi:hypothetical protein
LRLAAVVRRLHFGRDSDAPLIDLEAVARQAGVEIRRASFGAAPGGTEAILLPRDDGGFTAAIDPVPPGGWGSMPPGLLRGVEEHRTRFRIAHELGHTFFYCRSAGRPRRRESPGRSSEERFCDEFARALLVPPSAARTVPAAPDGIIMLHRRYRVSIEVAARSLAAHHPDRPSLAIFRAAGLSQLHLQWGIFRNGLRESALRAAVAATGIANRDCGVLANPDIAVKVLPRRRQVLAVAAP